MTCPRCNGTLFPDLSPETWEGKELVCLQCGNRVYDKPPEPWKHQIQMPGEKAGGKK